MNIYNRNRATMTKSEIIDQISHSKEWLGICRKIANGNDVYNDLYQEFLIVLLQMPDEKIMELNASGELRFYCVRILLNMFHGENTPFFKNYRSRTNDLPVSTIEEAAEYNHDIDTAIVRVEVFLQELPWYEREIFKGYVKHGSYRKFSKAIGIVAPSIAATVNKVRRKFKETVNLQIA